jgi:hypothetical protein
MKFVIQTGIKEKDNIFGRIKLIHENITCCE